MPNPVKKLGAGKTSTAVANRAPDEATLALLRAEFPTEPSFNRALLPRLTLISQDVTEEVRVNGKKQVNIITEAGMILKEHQEKKEDGTVVVDDETGKPVWNKEEIGTEVEVIIVTERKQLRYYDEETALYTSSPIYDTDDEVVPLFRDKAEVDRGLPADLQAKYPGTTAKGKPKSNLEVNRILYVLYENELYQLSNLRGTSLYSYQDFKRKARPAVPAILTSITSEPMVNGTTKWNKAIFTPVRALDAVEVKAVIEKVQEIKASIAEEKAFFAGKNAADAEFDSIKGRGEK